MSINNPSAAPAVVPGAHDSPDTPKANQKARQELRTAVQESNQILVKATSFGLFPDTVTLDRAQMTVTKRTFFQMADMFSIRVEDILNVTVVVGPVFGSLQIFSRVANINPCAVRYLWRADALRLKQISQSYLIAIQREIDMSSMSTPELVKFLGELDLNQ